MILIVNSPKVNLMTFYGKMIAIAGNVFVIKNHKK